VVLIRYIIQQKGTSDIKRPLFYKLMRNFEEKRTSAKWTKIAKYSVDIALRDIQDLMTKKVLQKENVGIN